MLSSPSTSPFPSPLGSISRDLKWRLGDDIERSYRKCRNYFPSRGSLSASTLLIFKDASLQELIKYSDFFQTWTPHFQVMTKPYTATDKRISNGTTKYWKPVPVGAPSMLANKTLQ